MRLDCLSLAGVICICLAPAMALGDDAAPAGQRDEKSAIAAIEAAGGHMRQHQKQAGKGVDRIVFGFEERNTFTDADLERLGPELESLASLSAITLPGWCLTERGAKVLRRLPRLRELNFSARPVSDLSLLYLEGLPDLEVLVFRESQITDKGLANLDMVVQRGGLKKLRRLVLVDLPITDEGVSHLAAFTSLESLVLGAARISNAGVKSLRPLRQLKELELFDTRIDDGVAEELLEFPRLRLLELSRTKIGDKTLSSIVPLKDLVELQLNETQVTDAGMIHLSQLPKLQVLSVGKTQVSNQAIRGLQKARAGLEVNGSK